VSSLSLLRDVTAHLRTEGWRVGNVDVTVICQEPRLMPHREAMRANLAGALGVSVGAVGVKATTTDGLGFEGRGEGVAAEAVCLLERDD